MTEGEEPKEDERRVIGRHLVADLSGCENIPKTAATIKKHAIRAAKDAGATVKAASARRDWQDRPKRKRGQGVAYEFGPAAISVDIVLAESHLTIHTWPEIKFIAVDIFTCGNTADPKKALNYLVGIFKPKYIDSRMTKRKARVRLD